MQSFHQLYQNTSNPSHVFVHTAISKNISQEAI